MQKGIESTFGGAKAKNGEEAKTKTDMYLNSGQTAPRKLSYEIDPHLDDEDMAGNGEESKKSMKDRTTSFKDAIIYQEIERLEQRKVHGHKKKGNKKGTKWNKQESHKELLGFEQFSTSPFDLDNGYDINELHLMHFTDKSVKKKHHKVPNFTAEQHVQANHRFILKPNSNQDYFFSTYEPDYFVEWDDILMVLAKRNTEYMCPICREEQLVAPIISKCGHIFCWPWILHYLLYASEAEGEDWRKCPLWEDIIHKRVLKLVKVFIKPPPKENTVRKFRLAFRNKASTVVKYYEESDTGKEERPKFKNLEVFYNDSAAYNICRIRVWKEYNAIFEEYKLQLTQNCKDSEGLGDTLRVGLIHDALESIDQLDKELSHELEIIYQQRATNVNNMDEIDQSNNGNNESIPQAKSSTSSKVQDLGNYRCLADTQKRDRYEEELKRTSGSYYFYQLDDETNWYLDPLWMKVLLKEYGSYSNLPLEISSNILEIEEYNMTENLRAKNKPIGHLPLSAEFKFIEVDMMKLVSYKSFEHFEKQIRQKENLRKRRLAQEQKYNDKAKLIEEKKYEHYVRTNMVVNTNRKTRLIPEWVTNSNIEDDTWFTLDGKEIKGQKKPSHNAWEGEDREEGKQDDKQKEEDQENEDDNVWNGFEIKPQGNLVDDFPALGGPIRNKPERIPVISNKKHKNMNKNVKTQKKTKIKYKNDEGEDKEVELSDSESQFLASKDSAKFTLDEFIVVDSNRNKRKKKRRH